MLTQARLKELLSYDPATGVFTWIVSQGTAKAGATAGMLDDGYVRIRVDGRKYRAHRLACLYMTGSFPTKQVDHRDTDRGNNRWSNLREATEVQQNANKSAQRNNASGVKGVSFFKARKTWRAVLYVSKKQKLLGYFKSKEEAAAAYRAAAVAQFGEFARF